MSRYSNRNGDTLEVIEKGKGFKTVQAIAGTNRVQGYEVVKNHRNFSAVEKLINRYNYTSVQAMSKQRDLLTAAMNGIAIILLGADEIALADQLAASGLLDKGTTDDKQRSINYTTTNKGRARLAGTRKNALLPELAPIDP